MLDQPHHEALAAPLAAFHARTPPRIWSLIISFLGDAILPRGGSVRAGVISDFCGLAGVEPGLVRTALSRLVSKGFLARSRDGRASFYRLTETERRAFADAADLIYGRRLPRPDGHWEVAVPDAGEHAADLRQRLERARFRALAPAVFLRPRHEGDHFAGIAGLATFDATAGRDVAALAARLWPLDEIASAYQGFIGTFSGLVGVRFSPQDGVLGRVLLAHEFRRILLRDPFLPAEVLPASWPGVPARRLFDAAHAALTPPAEAWLDAEG